MKSYHATIAPFVTPAEAKAKVEECGARVTRVLAHTRIVSFDAEESIANTVGRLDEIQHVEEDGDICATDDVH